MTHVMTLGKLENPKEIFRTWPKLFPYVGWPSGL